MGGVSKSWRGIWNGVLAERLCNYTATEKACPLTPNGIIAWDRYFGLIAQEAFFLPIFATRDLYLASLLFIIDRMEWAGDTRESLFLLLARETGWTEKLDRFWNQILT